MSWLKQPFVFDSTVSRFRLVTTSRMVKLHLLPACSVGLIISNHRSWHVKKKEIISSQKHFLKSWLSDPTPGRHKYWLSYPVFPTPGKNEPHKRVLAAFLRSDGINYVKKPTSIEMPLAAIERGAFLPYFGKRGLIKAYFLQPPNRTVLRGFPNA